MSEVIRGHRGHPRSFEVIEVIRGHQRASKAIRGRKRSSEVIRELHTLSVDVGARTAAASISSFIRASWARSPPRGFK
jgi:hypothetical protein